MTEINFTLFFLVFIMGGIGAMLRASILYLSAKCKSNIPYGIVLVNSLSTFLAVFIGNSVTLSLTVALPMLSGFVVALGTLSALCAISLKMILQRRIADFIYFIGLNAVFGLSSAILGQMLFLKTGVIYAI